jgi:hypothetical protein
VYETITICVAPLFWLGKFFLIYYFLKMGNFFLSNISDEIQVNKLYFQILFVCFGLLQMYSIVADDLITLFVSGYIFEDIEIVAKDLPEIDLAMTVINE